VKTPGVTLPKFKALFCLVTFASSLSCRPNR
jgi:hypothetical protein